MKYIVIGGIVSGLLVLLLIVVLVALKLKKSWKDRETTEGKHR